MFGRVAAGGIAAFLLVMPSVSNGETNPSFDAQASTAAAASVTPEPAQHPAQDQGQAKDHRSKQADDQTSGQSQDQEPSSAESQTQIILQTKDQTQILLRDPSQEPPNNRTQILLRDLPNDASAAEQRVAALDPVEPSDTSPAAAKLAIQSPAVTEPFGLNVEPAAGGDILTKWSGVEARIRADGDVLSRCRTKAEPCPAAAQAFLAIVAQGRAKTGRARIGVINRAVNLAIRPMSDLAQWGVIDRWSPPLETFTTGAGDCEDYAIAKYVALTEAGVAAADVRLVIVRNLAANEDHAVVAARLDGNWIILDNRWLRMVDDSEMSQAVPLFVLDQTGVWQFTTAMAPNARRASARRHGVAPGSLPSP